MIHPDTKHTESWLKKVCICYQVMNFLTDFPVYCYYMRGCRKGNCQSSQHDPQYKDASLHFSECQEKRQTHFSLHKAAQG